MADQSIPLAWNKEGLESVGFVGFKRFSDLPASPPPAIPGIYVVLRFTGIEPIFIEQSRVRPRAGKDLSYPVDVLHARWLPQAEVLYIGKANAKRGLQSRLRQYGSFAPNHSGGRSIWQLADADELLVAWMETPHADPAVVESSYLRAFETVHGGLPFANRRH